MKIIFITGLSFFMSLSSWWAPEPEKTNKIPVCHAPGNDMSAMAADEAFQNLHTNPIAFTYQGAGETVSFSTPDGKPAQGFLLKSKKKSGKWLLVYQE